MRKHAIDNLRTVTVLVVVVYHVVYIFNGLQPFGVVGAFYERQWWDHFQTLVYPWIMVLLFTIAGMSAKWSLDRRSPKAFARSRTVRLLVPVSLGLLVFQWIGGYFNMQISDAFPGLAGTPALVRYLVMCLSGISVLWFLQVLWLFSMLLLLVRKLEGGVWLARCAQTPVWVLPLLALPLWGAAQILNTPLISVYRFGFYGLAFFIGYFILSHEAVRERLSAWWLPLGITATGLGIAEVIVYRWQNYALYENGCGIVRDAPLTILYAWMASLALLAGMQRFANRTTPVMQWLSRNSWGLYLFHYIGISAAAWWMQGSGIPPAAQYGIVLLAGCGCGYLLGAVIPHIPVLRFCVMGISRPKENANVQG